MERTVNVDARSSFTFWREGSETDDGNRHELVTITLCASGDSYYDWYNVPTAEEMTDISRSMFMVPGGVLDEQQLWDELNSYVEEHVRLFVGQTKGVQGAIIVPELKPEVAKQYLISKKGWTFELDVQTDDELVQSAIELYKNGGN